MNAILTPLARDLLKRVDSSAALRVSFDEVIRRGEDSLVLGQFWYALHFTLSGEVPFPSTEARRQGVQWPDDPLMDALMGGDDAGIADDFGGARYHRADAVAHIAQALREVSEDELRESFDPDALIENDIPPAIWEDDLEAFHKIAAEFRRLRSFYSRCASEGAGVLLRVLRA